MGKKLILLVAAILASFIYGTPQASAVAGSDFRAGRIMDDVVFFTPNTMSVNDIQAFLNAKVPVCDTWHAGSGSNQPPFTCLKDYHQSTPNRSPESGLCNGHSGSDKMAANIIYEVAQSCGINPQVLLVLLQKEQSLITDTWPWQIQYRSATGFGCPDTAPCDAEYYGFFNQVYAAARQFRRYARDPGLFSHRAGRDNSVRFHPNAACGSSNVYIQTQATAGLYNYTPYQPNGAALGNLYGTGDGCSAYGNRNFWRLFNDWFGTPVIGATPSPLFKSASTHSIYAIAAGKKYLVPSIEVMVAFGFHNFNAQTVQDSFLDQYATGPTLTNVVQKATDPTIYLLDDGRRFPVTGDHCSQHLDGSANTSTSWGIDCFNPDKTKVVTNELLDMYTVQDIQLPQVILNQGFVWKIQGGKRRLITDPVFVEILGGWGATRWMKAGNAMQPIGKMLIPDQSLVKFDNAPNLYLIIQDQLYPLTGPDEIAAWGLAGRPAYVFPYWYNTQDPLTVNQSLKLFARDSGNTPYVLFANGTKASINGVSGDWNVAAYTTGLPDYVLGRLPTVALSNIYRSNSGSIYTTQTDKRRPFPTGEDFVNSGFNSGQIQPVSQSIESNFAYDGMKLAPGRLFKVDGGNGQIRYVQSEGSSLAVNSFVPGLPYDRLIHVDATTAAKYPVSGNYQ